MVFDKVNFLSWFCAVVWDWEYSKVKIVALVSNPEMASTLASHLVHGPEERYMVYMTWRGITHKHK